MTSYNRESLISFSIESVLNQKYVDYEFIIVDDASTDATWNVIQSYVQKDSRIKAYKNSVNIGDYPNRNKAASYATRKYIKYVDSDDILSADALEIMIRGMNEYPGSVIGLVGIGMNLSGQNYNLINQVDAYRYIYFKGKVIGCGPSFSIICRKTFLNIGGFSEKPYTSDFQLWLSLIAKYPLCLFKDNLVYWRQHAEQEYAKGMRSNFYLWNSFQIYFDALHLTFCPLPPDEKKIAITNLKNRYGRIIILYFIRGKFLLAIRLYKRISFGISDLFNSLLPNKYPLNIDYQYIK